MFSLVITVISILLVSALAVATLYYGGDALNKGADSARAAQIVLQGQQVLSAADLFKAEKGRWPASMEELVAGSYLKQVPSVQKDLAQGGPALTTVAYAAGEAVQASWEMPSAGRPTFVLNSAVKPNVCRQVNVKTRGDDGILKKAYSDAHTQCFGDAAGLTVVVTREAESLTEVLGTEKAIQGVSLKGNPSEADYFVAPGTSVAGAPQESGGPSETSSLVVDVMDYYAQSGGKGGSNNSASASIKSGAAPTLVFDWKSNVLGEYYAEYYASLWITNVGDSLVIPQFSNTTQSSYNLTVTSSYQEAYDWAISDGFSEEEARLLASDEDAILIADYGVGSCVPGATLNTGESCMLTVSGDILESSVCGTTLSALTGKMALNLVICQSGMTAWMPPELTAQTDPEAAVIFPDFSGSNTYNPVWHSGYVHRYSGGSYAIKFMEANGAAADERKIEILPGSTVTYKTAPAPGNAKYVLDYNGESRHYFQDLPSDAELKELVIGMLRDEGADYSEGSLNWQIIRESHEIGVYAGRIEVLYQPFGQDYFSSKYFDVEDHRQGSDVTVPVTLEQGNSHTDGEMTAAFDTPGGIDFPGSAFSFSIKTAVINITYTYYGENPKTITAEVPVVMPNWAW